MLLNQNHTVCPKIETEFLGSSEIRTFFQPKNGWSPKKKKKKKIFTEIETDFPAKIGNSNVFSAQKQVVSKKKKKKVFAEIETDFPAKIGNSNAFSGQITTCTSQLRHPISFGGGAVFNFSSKTYDFAYFTSQWESSSPPLATLLATTSAATTVTTYKTTRKNLNHCNSYLVFHRLQQDFVFIVFSSCRFLFLVCKTMIVTNKQQ